MVECWNIGMMEWWNLKFRITFGLKSNIEYSLINPRLKPGVSEYEENQGFY